MSQSREASVFRPGDEEEPDPAPPSLGFDMSSVTTRSKSPAEVPADKTNSFFRIPLDAYSQIRTFPHDPKMPTHKTKPTCSKFFAKVNGGCPLAVNTEGICHEYAAKGYCRKGLFGDECSNWHVIPTPTAYIYHPKNWLNGKGVCGKYSMPGSGPEGKPMMLSALKARTRVMKEAEQNSREARDARVVADGEREIRRQIGVIDSKEVIRDAIRKRPRERDSDKRQRLLESLGRIDEVKRRFMQ